jgi:hypothetical protein
MSNRVTMRYPGRIGPPSGFFMVSPVLTPYRGTLAQIGVKCWRENMHSHIDSSAMSLVPQGCPKTCNCGPSD